MSVLIKATDNRGETLGLSSDVGKPCRVLGLERTEVDLESTKSQEGIVECSRGDRMRASKEGVEGKLDDADE